jgi:probable F420-dependent oxidoreductase
VSGPRPATSRPWRFGANGSAPTPERWKALARRVESLGYATLVVPDHIAIVAEIGPLTAMTLAAEATRTLRIGSLVLANDLRHPAVLAKELATIDLVSDGRLEIGLGAGWLRSDFDAIGVRFDPPATRIDRLGESIRIIKGLMADGPFEFSGRHYEIRGVEGIPKPAVRPHPPFLVAGGGRRVLELAAREADTIGINVSLPGGVLAAGVAASATDDATRRRIEWIRAAAGVRFDDLELSTFAVAVAVTDDPEAAARALAETTGMTPEQVLASPQCFVGPVSRIVDHLTALRETYGITYVAIPSDDVEAFAPVVERLA